MACSSLRLESSQDNKINLQTKRRSSCLCCRRCRRNSTKEPVAPLAPVVASPDILSPSRWAISFQQLLDLDHIVRTRFGERYSEKTMRDVNDAIIKPACAHTGTSWALQENPHGLELDVFVTHAWDEQFADFLLSIQSVFHHTLRKPNLWICALALVQSDDSAIIARQVGDVNAPLERSPFVRALRAAKQFLVVRNNVTDLYMRLWCVFELHYAIQFQLVPDSVMIAGPDAFREANTGCLDAKCYSNTDRAKILSALLEGDGATERVEQVDAMIKEFRAFSTRC